MNDDEVAVVWGEHLDNAIRELHVHREERSVHTGVKAQVGVVGRRERQQVVDQRPQIVLAEIVVELAVAAAVEVHREVGEILHEVVVKNVGRDDLGFGRGGQRTDEGGGRRKAARELERHRFGVDGEGEAER